MEISCLCPTYGRPHCLINSILCFLSQTHPSKELIILDDADDYVSDVIWRDEKSVIRLASIPYRFRSLPDKYNAMASLAEGRLLSVWEDDDIYLPWHLSQASEYLDENDSSRSCWYPSVVLSTYGNKVHWEQTIGRFHASLCFTRKKFEEVGGWPITRRADFDLQFLRRIRSGCPMVENQVPSYMFQGRTSRSYHAQEFMNGPDDVGWYSRYPGPTSSFEPWYRDCVSVINQLQQRLVLSLISQKINDKYPVINPLVYRADQLSIADYKYPDDVVQAFSNIDLKGT